MEDFLTAIIILFSPFILFFVIVTIARIIHGGPLPMTTKPSESNVHGLVSFYENDIYGGKEAYNPTMIGSMAWNAWGEDEEKAGRF